jgi:NAD-dependent dihydropyrimidine dehydrogenase PreA subunit
MPNPQGATTGGRRVRANMTTPTRTRSTTSSAPSSSRRCAAAPSAGSSTRSASASGPSASRCSRPQLHHRPRARRRLRRPTSTSSSGDRRHPRRPRRHGAAAAAVLLPPDLGDRRAALRRAPRQPMDPALLVPRALPPRRDPRASSRASRRVGMEKDHSKCTDCNLCLVDCQGADSPQGGVKWRQDECHMCLNCEVACPEDVIKFRWLPNRRSARSPRTTSTAARPSSRPSPAPRCSPRPHQRHPRRQLLRPAHPTARLGARARLHGALHPLRGVHEGVPQQRPPPGLPRERHRGPVDAHPHPPHRLLRAHLRPLRPGVPHRRDPEDHRGAEARRPRAAHRAHQDRHGLLRPRPLPALVDGHPLHRVRRVLPDLAEGHLGGGDRRARPQRPHRARAAPPRRPAALHRLRRLREGLPGARPPRGVRHLRGRVAQRAPT